MPGISKLRSRGQMQPAAYFFMALELKMIFTLLKEYFLKICSGMNLCDPQNLNYFLFCGLCRAINNIWAHLGLLCFADTVIFLQIEPCMEQVCQCIFFPNIYSFHGPVPHFNNFCNISNFFIITIFVTVICDQ